MKRKEEYVPETSVRCREKKAILEKDLHDKQKELDKVNAELDRRQKAKQTPFYKLLAVVLCVVIIVGGMVFYIYPSRSTQSDNFEV